MAALTAGMGIVLPFENMYEMVELKKSTIKLCPLEVLYALNVEDLAN